MANTEVWNWSKQKKIETSVFKVDYEKAFDNMDWDSLLLILKLRGFPPR